mmetsp:Transcript_22302/g.47472  ORF Transcript_22302/g.47472 Transcript_22302/m.47472 type:complete len:360 (-) Transcript_22302:464-1543(-)
MLRGSSKPRLIWRHRGRRQRRCLFIRRQRCRPRHHAPGHGCDADFGGVVGGRRQFASLGTCSKAGTRCRRERGTCSPFWRGSAPLRPLPWRGQGRVVITGAEVDVATSMDGSPLQRADLRFYTLLHVDQQLQGLSLGCCGSGGRQRPRRSLNTGGPRHQGALGHGLIAEDDVHPAHDDEDAQAVKPDAPCFHTPQVQEHHSTRDTARDDHGALVDGDHEESLILLEALCHVHHVPDGEERSSDKQHVGEPMEPDLSVLLVDRPLDELDGRLNAEHVPGNGPAGTAERDTTDGTARRVPHEDEPVQKEPCKEHEEVYHHSDVQEGVLNGLESVLLVVMVPEASSHDGPQDDESATTCTSP